MTTKLRAASFQDNAVTTAKIAADAITNAKIADDAVQTENVASTVNLGRRNMVINGGMEICQRSTSETGLGGSEVYFVQDRYKIGLGDATAGRFTATKETSDVPDGFKSAMKLACTTADTSIAAGEFFAINQHIESDICVRTAAGTSSAKEVTLSFYAKANANATYVVQLLNNKHSSYIHNNRTFSVTTSWQRFTMTFQADTTADSKFDGDLTAGGFSLAFILHAGSNYTSATLASDWATGVTNRAAGADSFFDSTSNTFFITGVQLEVGSQATPFEHRSFGEELALCQRYYYRINGNAGGSTTIGMGFSNVATQSYSHIALPVNMRTSPSVTGSGFTASDFNSYTITGTSLQINNAENSNQGCSKTNLIVNVSSGLTVLRPSGNALTASTSSFCAFASEL